MHCNCVRQDVNRSRCRRGWGGRARRGVLRLDDLGGRRKPHGYAGLSGVGCGHVLAQVPDHRRRVGGQPRGDRTYVRSGKGRSRRNGCSSVILRRFRLVILRRFRAGRRGCLLNRSWFGCDYGIRVGRRGCPGVSRGVGCCGCGRNRVGGICSRRGRESSVRRERRRNERGAADKAQTADARFSIAD